MSFLGRQFSDNILLNCKSIIRIFFFTAQLIHIAKDVFVAKNYTMLFDSTQRPSTLVVKSNQIKSNPSFRHVTPRSTTRVLVKTCTSVQIKMYSSNLYITTIKILTINRSTKWLKTESKTKAIYRIYKPYTFSRVSFKRSLKRRNVL